MRYSTIFNIIYFNWACFVYEQDVFTTYSGVKNILALNAFFVLGSFLSLVTITYLQEKVCFIFPVQNKPMP